MVNPPIDEVTLKSLEKALEGNKFVSFTQSPSGVKIDADKKIVNIQAKSCNVSFVSRGTYPDDIKSVSTDLEFIPELQIWRLTIMINIINSVQMDFEKGVPVNVFFKSKFKLDYAFC